MGNTMECSVVESAKSAPPFDNTITLANGDRYLIDPLAEDYLIVPGDTIPEGMLPPEEFQVQAAIVEMVMFTKRIQKYGFFSRLFRTKIYLEARSVALEKQRELRSLGNSSQAHRAALIRISKTVPLPNSRILSNYLNR